MIGLLILLLGGCLSPPTPYWMPHGKLPESCDNAGLPRSRERAAQSLSESSGAQVSFRAWSYEELVALGLKSSELQGLVFVQAQVKIESTPLGGASPDLILVVGASQLKGCGDCNYRWIAEQLEEWEDRPLPPQENSGSERSSGSSAAGNILKGPKPKGVIGALTNLITLPVRMIIAGTVMAADALDALSSGSSSGPTTERIYGGPRTDQVAAILLGEPTPASPGNPGSVSRLIRLNSEGEDTDPVLYHQDQVVILLHHTSPNSCSALELHSYPLPPGAELIERINRAASAALPN